MRRWILLALVAAVVAGWGWRRQRTEQHRRSTDTEFVRARAERRDVVQTVAANGRVVAHREVEIKCKASGTVIEVAVDESDVVRQGDLLFRLDPVDEERSVKRLENALAITRARAEQAAIALQTAEHRLRLERDRTAANLKTAESREKNAAEAFRRADVLHAGGVMSEEERNAAEAAAVEAESTLQTARLQVEDLKTQELAIEQSRHDLQIVRAQVENDETALADARQRLADTVVHAPIDGVVTARFVQEGQIISSGISNVGGGTTAMRLADLSRMYVVAAVDEANIARIHPGMEARVTVDALQDSRFLAVVERVAAAGQVASNVVTFNVKMEVQGRASLLRPEMSANVELTVARSESAVTVPVEAIRHRNLALGEKLLHASGDFAMVAEPQEVGTIAITTGGGSWNEPLPPIVNTGPIRAAFVRRVNPDGVETEIQVVAGVSDGEFIEIKMGLAEGDEVAFSPGGASRWRAGSGKTEAQKAMGPFVASGKRK